MRVAVSGVGLRSTKVLGYLKTAMPEVTFVGYFDPSPSPDFLKLLGDDIASYPSVEALLSESKPDLFFIGSPNHVHLEQIELGLKAGVRVFSEKPVVTDIEQTWKLLDLLRNYGSDRVMVGLVLRYSPQMVDLRRSMKHGEIGDIISMEANEHINPAHGSFFMRDWRRYEEYSGGFMLEKCVHDIDLYNMIAASRPIKVASFGGRRTFLPQNMPVEKEEIEYVYSKMPIWRSGNDAYNTDSDIIDFQTALISYQSGTSLAFHTNLCVPKEQRRFLVLGAKGMAEGDFQRGYLRITATPSGRRIEDIDYTKSPEALIDHYGADAQMGRDIAAFLRGEIAHLPVSILDALEAGVAAIMIDEARRSGQVVDLTKTWQRFDSYGLSECA